MEAAGGSYGLELMVFQVGLQAAGCGKSVEELVLGIIHLIGAEDGAKAAFVKGAVMGYQREAFDQRLNLCPHIGENWGIVGVSTAQAMHLSAPVVIIVGLGLDERVELVHNLPVTDNDHSNGAYRRTIIVGGLEIYSCKISPGLIFLITVKHTLDFCRHLLTKPLWLEHFNILALPE